MRALFPLLLLAPLALAAQASPDSAAPVAARTRIFPIPAVFYTPETRMGAGAAVSLVRRRARAAEGDRPTSASVFAIYTQEGQFQSSASAEHWTPGNRWQLGGRVGFRRFPFQYFGTGSAVPDTGEDYTPRTISTGARALRRVAGALYLGGSATYETTRLLETAEAGVLRDGTITGSRGGAVSIASALASWDTRDNVYASEAGAWVQLGAHVAAPALGSDFAYRRLSLDARRYVALAPGSRTRAARVLALQALADVSGGDVPFDRLPSIGGQNVVRGYYDARFRDRTAVALQAELRAPVWRRLGATAFVGAGEVARTPGRLRLAEVRPAGGIGLRVALSKDERLNVRIDRGMGQGGSSGTYVTVGEAF